MHIIFIIIHRYVIRCIDRMNRCDIRFFFYIEYIIYIFITCIIHYFLWILMTLYFFTCVIVICYLIIDNNNLLCISFSFQSDEFF